MPGNDRGGSERRRARTRQVPRRRSNCQRKSSRRKKAIVRRASYPGLLCGLEGSEELAWECLMLEQKFIGVEQCPADVFQPRRRSLAFAAVGQRHSQFLFGGGPRNGSQIQFTDRLLDRSAVGKQLSKTVVGVSQFLMNRRAIKQFDRHPKVGILNPYASTYGTSFGLTKHFQEIDGDDVGRGQLRCLRPNRQAAKGLCQPQRAVDRIEQLLGAQ